MNYDELYKKVVELPIGSKETIMKLNGVEIYIFRPKELPKKLEEKGYKLEKNFQIFLKEGKRKFKPNHLRVLIDLYLRTKFKPELKNKILELFDNMFYKKEYNKLLSELKTENFEHYLNKDLEITIYLYLLFLIEQDYNYIKKSNYEPKTLFLHGWIRQIICDDSRELDNLLVSAARGQSPKNSYTKLDSKIKQITRKKQKITINNLDYNENPKSLWYL